MRNLWTVIYTTKPHSRQCYFYAVMPNGVKLPKQTEIRIHETVDAFECDVKFLVNGGDGFVSFDGQALTLNGEVLPDEWFKELSVMAYFENDRIDEATIKIDAKFCQNGIFNPDNQAQFL